MSLPVKLENFEGPLDLLLHLIDKNKMNIYDIPISIITQQYLAYMKTMDTDEMEIMSEFIEMAATLMSIKARMLLPKIQVEEAYVDPRQELIERLIEYKKYKLISQQLKELQGDAYKSVFKIPTIPDEVKAYMPVIDPAKLLENIEFGQLYKVFQSVMKKNVGRIDPIRSQFGRIKKEEFTVQDKMVDLLNLRKKLKGFSFKGLLEEQTEKIEQIVSFLAILELIKLGKIRITQLDVFEDIYIEFV